MKTPNTYAITASALTGAAYAALTLLLAPISYGPIQLRVSELLCVLPFFMPCSAWGLFAGCLLANLLTGNALDVIFGSLATLFAALVTAQLGSLGNTAARRALACLSVVLTNAVIVGAVITRAYNGMGILSHPGVFALNAAQIALGEGLVMFVGGLPLMSYLPKSKVFRDLVEKTEKAA